MTQQPARAGVMFYGPGGRQQGVAAILFVLMLPVLLGAMTLGVEGARYLAIKNRLGDAVEVASLAISARGSEDMSANKELAEAYIRAMMPDIGELEIALQFKGNGVDKGQGVAGGTRGFREYRLGVSSRYTSWFPQWDGKRLGFEREVAVGARATSRKYYGSSMDVVFVADFSGSMNSPWLNNGARKKIDVLKEAVASIATRLEKTSAYWPEKNTMAMVPFNRYTWEKTEGKGNYCNIRQLFFNDAQDEGVWKKDITKAMDNLFKEKACTSTYKELPAGKRFEKGMGYRGPTADQLRASKSNIENFYTLKPTTDAKGFIAAVQGMNANGDTASYEGIIRGAQLLRQGNNGQRLMIILSDGMDQKSQGDQEDLSPYPDDGGEPLKDHKALLKVRENRGNYCDKIRAELERQKTTGGRQVNARIAVIGINYDIEKNPALKDCAGADNVFTANTIDELNTQLDKLIRLNEEVGHLYGG